MISVPNSTPKTVSFTQVVNNQTASIAKAQVGKLALSETQARGEMENANFYLAKATEILKSAEIAYRESVVKSSWNKEALRSTYNNAIAGYRDADRRAQSATEAFTLAKSALEGTYVSAGLVEKNVEEVQNLDTNEISKSIRKESTMDMSNRAIANALAQDMSEYPADPAVTCLDCNAHGCGNCGGSGFMPVSVVFGKSVASGAFDFTTESLLTRDFEKSAAYQDYIFTKGGKGSGPKPGHKFGGNQHTGGMRDFPRLGITEGTKQTLKRYQDGAETATTAARSHEKLAEGHLRVGRKAAAAAELRQAAALHMTAAGFHEGIAGLHKKEFNDLDKHKASRGDAARSRVYAGRAKDMANQLDGGAGAAVA